MFKRIAIVIGTLVALLLAAVVLIPLLIDPNDYKDRIAGLARDATGRELAIIDDMKLSVFPWLGVEFGRVEFANAAGFGPQPFARIAAAKIKVRLLPLLQRRIEVGTVTLHGLELSLATTADGRTNWDDLAARAAPEHGAGAATPAPSSGSAALALPAAFSIGGLDVRDGALRWRDDAGGTRLDITGLRLASGRIEAGKPVDLEAAFDLHGAEPALDGRLELSTRLTLDPTLQRLRSEGLRLSISLAGQALPTEKLQLALEGNVEADLNRRKVGAENLRLQAVMTGGRDLPADKIEISLQGALQGDLAGQVYQARELQLQARMSGRDLPAETVDLDLKGNIQADLAGQTYRSDHLRLDATLAGAALPGGRLAIELQGDLEADLARQTLTLPAFALKAAGVGTHGELHVTHLLDGPQITGRLQSAPFNPRELMKSLAMIIPQTSDAAALARATFEFDFEAAADHAALTALKLQLDDSTLTGTAAARNFSAPALTFNLALDRIDLDRYLPPAQDKPAVATPSAAAPAALQLPLDTLRALDLDGRLTAGGLRVSGLALADLRATVRAKDGLIALAPLGASLYGGRYAGNIRLDARGEVPAFSLKESLTGIQAAPLLRDLLDNETFSGTADFALDATARGETMESLLGSLTGQARVGLRNGAVKGFNTAQMIREAKARLEGRPAPPATVNQTDLSELAATLRLDGGIARNDDLQASSPYLRIGGKGQADLIKQELDYRLRVKLVGSEIGQGGEQSGNLRGIEIPLRISGPFAGPSVALDSAVIRDALGQKAKAAIQEAVDASKDRIEEKVEQKRQEIRQDAEEKLKSKLKGLLK